MVFGAKQWQNERERGGDSTRWLGEWAIEGKILWLHTSSSTFLISLIVFEIVLFDIARDVVKHRPKKQMEGAQETKRLVNKKQKKMKRAGKEGQTKLNVRLFARIMANMLNAM